MTIKKLYFIIGLMAICGSASAEQFYRVHGKVAKLYSESFGFTFAISDNQVSQQCGGIFSLPREITNRILMKCTHLYWPLLLAKPMLKLL